MIIKDLSQNTEMKFNSLELEDIFKYDGRLFMKVSNNYDSGYNAYDFSKSRLTDFDKDTNVRYVPSELILHERGWGMDN